MRLITLSCLLFTPLAAVAGTTAHVIADFESPPELARWSGLDRAPDNTFHSSGAASMRFNIPQWREGCEERPGILLPCTVENGFPSGTDLSGWDAIAVDVRVVGDKAGKLGLKVRDVHGENSWTTHITVEPGRTNTAVLTMADAGSDCDIRQTREVVLYALRPDTAFTLLVDNLRLLPKKELPPTCAFALVYPNYRDMIFPGGGRVAVACDLALKARGIDARETVLTASLSDGGQTVKTAARPKNGRQTIELSPASLAHGDLTLRVALRRSGNNRMLASREWQLRKITPEERDALRVWYDRRNVLHADGKPFFPLGWYGKPDAAQLAEVAEGPFNCMLMYGTNHAGRDTMTGLLDDMHARGMKLVYCLNDVYPTAKYFEEKGWNGVTGNDAIAAAVLDAYKEHPAVLAWYLNDELPREIKPQLLDYYRRVREGDPSRPSFIVLCNRRDFPVFHDTTDILGVDPYPVPNDPITRVSGFVDFGREAVNNAKPVWLVPQAFAWYQYKSKDKDRGHTPTAEELRTGRAPTREEERCMTWLGIAHGATGLIYYCYYDMRVLPQYAEMWGWMREIAGEVREFSPVLLEGEDAPGLEVRRAGRDLHTRLISHGGALYLIAVNTSPEPAAAEMRLPRRVFHATALFGDSNPVECRGRTLRLPLAPLEARVIMLDTGKTL